MTTREYQYHLLQRRKRFTIIPESKILYAKKACPFCGGNVSISCTGWEYDEKTKLWIATDVEVTCTKEPDIESEEWEDWFNWHYNTPYIDWLQLQIRIRRTLKKKYRYKLKNN